MNYITVKTPEDAINYNNIQKNSNSIVMFYGDFCGHCKKIKPMMQKEFAEFVNSNYPKTKLIFVDIASEGYNHIEGFGKNNQLNGVPTIMYFTKNQENKFEYDPPLERSFDTLVEFVNKIERSNMSGGKRRQKNTRKYKSRKHKKSHKNKLSKRNKRSIRKLKRK